MVAQIRVGGWLPVCLLAEPDCPGQLMVKVPDQAQVQAGDGPTRTIRQAHNLLLLLDTTATFSYLQIKGILEPMLLMFSFTIYVHGVCIIPYR